MHVPFAHWLVRAAAPEVLVELGTFNGVSYSAFCHAVVQSGLPTRCHAVDTWCGDSRAGETGDEVYEDFHRFHDQHYDQFSTLLRCTFDAALERFADGSIDLLHIGGATPMRRCGTILRVGCQSFRNVALFCFIGPMSETEILGLGEFGRNCASDTRVSNSYMVTGSEYLR